MKHRRSSMPLTHLGDQFFSELEKKVSPQLPHRTLASGSVGSIDPSIRQRRPQQSIIGLSRLRLTMAKSGNKRWILNIIDIDPVRNWSLSIRRRQLSPVPPTIPPGNCWPLRAELLLLLRSGTWPLNRPWELRDHPGTMTEIYDHRGFLLITNGARVQEDAKSSWLFD